MLCQRYRSADLTLGFSQGNDGIGATDVGLGHYQGYRDATFCGG